LKKDLNHKEPKKPSTDDCDDLLPDTDEKKDLDDMTEDEILDDIDNLIDEHGEDEILDRL